MTTISPENEVKYKTSKLFELCQKLWPEEFVGMFTAKREAFRDWMNKKTGLEMDHIINKRTAVLAWVEVLEKLNKEG